MRYYSLLLCVLLCLPVTRSNTQEAVIIVPVADLIGQPLASYTIRSYADLPLCPRQLHNRYNGCPRLHQALYNERVTLLKIVNNEVYIAITQLFYDANNQKQATYWTDKNNIRTIADLKKTGIDQNTIPPALSFHNISVTTDNQNSITLSKPWFDRKTGCTFSAGTRFIINKVPTPRSPSIEVHAIDAQTLQPYTMCIDKKHCLFNKTKSKPEQRKLFLKIVREWAHLPGCFIPYVWGGSSFTSCSRAQQIDEKKNNQPDAYFSLCDYNESPKTGFDCAGLVSRAAQTAGIAYFYKNTTTLAHNLTPITTYASLQNGDLLWIPGHVMIISDIENGLLIEARSYHHGYGKVHEIRLDKVFKNIATYADLFKALQEKKPITRIDKDGSAKEEISNYRFLSLFGDK